MPGVHHILTYKNAPKLQRPNVARGRILPEPLPREINLQGEAVAIVVAETEDLAQDAADAIKVEYEVLRFASMLKDSMAADAPDLGHGKGNLIRHSFSPQDLPNVTWRQARQHRKGFAEADGDQGVRLPLTEAFRCRCSRAAASPNGMATG
jgi:CO/xanthine dehydrogenase Mo-binding subunit